MRNVVAPPPCGSATRATCRATASAGSITVTPGPAAVRRAVGAVSAGGVVSLHLGHPGTVDALPGVLDDLAGRGLTPVAAGTLFS